MTNLKLSRDKNGNKTLNFYNSEMGGFSIQTNGNLPKTHAMTRDNFNPAIAGEELKKYVIFFRYGSPKADNRQGNQNGGILCISTLL